MSPFVTDDIVQKKKWKKKQKKKEKEKKKKFDFPSIFYTLKAQLIHTTFTHWWGYAAQPVKNSPLNIHSHSDEAMWIRRLAYGHNSSVVCYRI